MFESIIKHRRPLTFYLQMHAAMTATTIYSKSIFNDVNSSKMIQTPSKNRNSKYLAENKLEKIFEKKNASNAILQLKLNVNFDQPKTMILKTMIQ